MGGMREGLQGAFWVAKDGIVKSLSVFPFISVYHEVFCWPGKVTTCPILTSPRPFLFRPTWGCSIMSYQQAFFSQVWVSLLWVEVMLGENGSGSHNWSWEISFLTKKILVCNKSAGDVCSYDRVRRDCQETKPESFDIFLLSFAATAVWRERGEKERSHQVGRKQAASPQLWPASWKSSEFEDETCCLLGLWMQCAACHSQQPCRGARPTSFPCSQLFVFRLLSVWEGRGVPLQQGDHIKIKSFVINPLHKAYYKHLWKEIANSFM